MAHPKFETLTQAALAAYIALGIAAVSAGCGSRSHAASSDRPVDSSQAASASVTQAQPEQKSGETKSVQPQVQTEINKADAEKRATLLTDAQSALEETRKALAALDRGDKKAALAALANASGKLELVVSRDSRLALAPVSVDTVVYDLYATPDAIKTVVKQVRGELSDDRVQQARRELQYLASEADVNVTELPLASYPAAIKAVAPLIDQGRLDEAKAAIATALSSLVIDTLVIPLPRVRAEALLGAAQQLTSKSSRTQAEQDRALALLAAARNEVQLAEALGYGTKADYKPLYSQMDDLQKAAKGGNAGTGLFDRVRESLKRFKFSG